MDTVIDYTAWAAWMAFCFAVGHFVTRWLYKKFYG